MTSEEILDTLALKDWKAKMKVVWKESIFKVQRNEYEKYPHGLAATKKADEKAAEKATKVGERKVERV